MRFAFWIALLALILLLGGVLSLMMQADAGVIMVAWNGWMIETTFWTGIGTLLSFGLALWIVITLMRRFGPQRLLAAYRRRRGQTLARKETAAAINHWLSGNSGAALESLQKVVSAGGSERLPRAVALAVDLLGSDWPERYHQFNTDDPELSLFANALKAERLWQLNQPRQFVELLQADKGLKRLAMFRERYWQSMLDSGNSAELLVEVNEAPNIKPERRQHWIDLAVKKALPTMTATPQEGSKLLKSLSRPQRSTIAIQQAEIRYLIDTAQHDQAFKLARQFLAVPANEHHAEILLDIQIENRVKLEFLEARALAEPTPVLCRVAGILSWRQQLWGKAQEWLEKGWQQQDARCGQLLSELLEERGMKEETQRLQKQLLLKMINETSQ